MHPAGPKYFKDYAGCDTSIEFDQVGHSENAYSLLYKYYVGDLIDEDVVTNNAIASSLPKKWTKNILLKTMKKVSHNVVLFTFEFAEEFEMWLEPG